MDAVLNEISNINAQWKEVNEEVSAAAADNREKARAFWMAEGEKCEKRAKEAWGLYHAIEAYFQTLDLINEPPGETRGPFIQNPTTWDFSTTARPCTSERWR